MDYRLRAANVVPRPRILVCAPSNAGDDDDDGVAAAHTLTVFAVAVCVIAMMSVNSVSDAEERWFF